MNGKLEKASLRSVFLGGDQEMDLRQIWEQNWARMILIEMGLNIRHLVV